MTILASAPPRQIRALLLQEPLPWKVQFTLSQKTELPANMDWATDEQYASDVLDEPGFRGINKLQLAEAILKTADNPDELPFAPRAALFELAGETRLVRTSVVVSCSFLYELDL